jgi:hypothetical protein
MNGIRLSRQIQNWSQCVRLRNTSGVGDTDVHIWVLSRVASLSRHRRDTVVCPWKSCGNSGNPRAHLRRPEEIILAQNFRIRIDNPKVCGAGMRENIAIVAVFAGSCVGTVALA